MNKISVSHWDDKFGLIAWIFLRQTGFEITLRLRSTEPQWTQKSKAIRNAMLQTLCDCCYPSQRERLHAASENIMLILFFPRWIAKLRSMKTILISILYYIHEYRKLIIAYSISDTAYAKWIIRKFSFHIWFQ